MSKFLSQVLDVKDLELQSRLNKPHSRNEFFNRGNNNNNNNYPFIPPCSHPQPPQPSYVSPLSAIQPPNLSDLLRNNRPPSLPLPPPPLLTRQPPNLSFFNNEQTSVFPTPPAPARKTSTVTNATQTTSRDRLISKLELVIEKEKPKEKLKADNGVTFVLPKIPTILDDDKYEKKKEIKNKRMRK